MVSPVPGYRITTPYHLTGKRWTACGWHTGVDYAAPAGTPVVASISGTIRHRNYGISSFGPFQFAISPSAGQPFADDEVFYAHVLSRLPDGTEVKAGQVISKVGSLGNATGPHLHYEYHKGKKTWNCASMRDPAPTIAFDSPTAPPVAPPAASQGPYVTKDVYSNKMGMGEPSNGDAESDSVKELRARLDKISLVGGSTIGTTPGVYDLAVDKEVRLWQAQVVKDTPDAAGKSYLGPKQFAAMFPTPPYTRHESGLPAVATNSGGSGGSDGGGSVPPPGTPSGSVRPVVPDLIFPTAEWDPIQKADGTWFVGLRPFVGHAKKITLHTTETAVKPNWKAQGSGIPHFTVDLRAWRIWQHLPLDMAAYTLKGGEKSPNSDSGMNIQIEIIGFAANSPGWSDAEYTHLASLTAWLSLTCAVPYMFPCVFGVAGNYSRLSWEAWYPLSGIMGHQHVPYNDHSDPGALDVARLLRSEIPITPDPTEPPVPVVPTEPPVEPTEPTEPTEPPVTPVTPPVIPNPEPEPEVPVGDQIKNALSKLPSLPENAPAWMKDNWATIMMIVAAILIALIIFQSL